MAGEESWIEADDINPFIPFGEMLVLVVMGLALLLFAVAPEVKAAVEDDGPALGMITREVTDRELRFASGEAVPESVTALGGILQLVLQRIEEGYTRIRVEGHTDNVPINTGRFPSNWELSSARAIWLARQIEAHLESAAPRLAKSIKVEAIGYGERDPVSSNVTMEGRRRNRRITLTFER